MDYYHVRSPSGHRGATANSDSSNSSNNGMRVLENKIADLISKNDDLNRKVEYLQNKDRENDKKIANLTKEVKMLAALLSNVRSGQRPVDRFSESDAHTRPGLMPQGRNLGFASVMPSRGVQEYLNDKDDYSDRLSRQSSNCGSRISLHSDMSSGSSYKEFLKEYDFVFELPSIKKQYMNAKRQNHRYKEVRCDGLYEDEDGYNFGLLVQPCGGEGFFTFDKFLCVGLVCSKTKQNKDNHWPINTTFVLALFSPGNPDDILISKKRDRQFTGPGAREWIFKFCSLNRVFGLHRQFDTPYTEGDKLCIGLKFIDSE